MNCQNLYTDIQNSVKIAKKFGKREDFRTCTAVIQYCEVNITNVYILAITYVSNNDSSLIIIFTYTSCGWIFLSSLNLFSLRPFSFSQISQNKGLIHERRIINNCKVLFVLHIYHFSGPEMMGCTIFLCTFLESWSFSVLKGLVWCIYCVKFWSYTHLLCNARGLITGSDQAKSALGHPQMVGPVWFGKIWTG